jgi:hypothetical protein
MKKINIQFILLIAISVSLSSCFKDLWCIQGEGDIIEVELDLDDINAIEASGAFDIYISQGESQIIKAKGHENIIDRLETFVSGETWQAELDDEFCYRDYQLALYLTLPDLEAITITGSSDVVVEDFIDQESLEISIVGSGNAEFNDFKGAKTFDIKISGSGDVECLGDFDQLEDLNIQITGSGNIEAYKAITQSCDIDIAGSGNCKVYVEEKLNVDISGVGNIYYKGNPGITTNITGSGDLYDEN